MRLTLCALLLATPVAAQSPSLVVPEALRSLLSAPGSCGGEFQLQPASFAYFPSVRFYRGICIAEHGDSASATVAVDSDSVLYLLSSKDAFNFLVDRHPPANLKGEPDLGYALLALELSGATIGPVRLAPNGGAPAGQAAPWTKTLGRGAWTAVFGTLAPTSEGPVQQTWTVTIERGHLVTYEAPRPGP